MMTQLEQLKALYEDYIKEANRVIASKKFGEGLFGFGAKAADDPCHEKFVLAMREALIAMKAEDSATLRETLSWVFRMAAPHEKTASIYWTLVAAQMGTLELIPLLSAADAATLYNDYQKENRRWNRLPVQDSVLKQLKKAARAK